MAEKRWVYVGRADQYSRHPVVYRYPLRRLPLRWPTHVAYFKRFWHSRWRRAYGQHAQEGLDNLLQELKEKGEILREEEIDDFLNNRDPMRDLICGEDPGC